MRFGLPVGLNKKKTQKLAVHAVGCAHDSGEKRNVLIVSTCLLIGVGFTLRSNTHRAVKVLGMREGHVLLHMVDPNLSWAKLRSKIKIRLPA